MALLSGVGVGAAVVGLTRALIGMGVPEYMATGYEGRVKGGCILLLVHADDSKWTARAKQFSRQQAQTILHRLEKAKATAGIRTNPRTG